MKHLLLSALLLSTSMGAESLTFNLRTLDPLNELTRFNQQLETQRHSDPAIAAALTDENGNLKFPKNKNEAIAALSRISETRAVLKQTPDLRTFSSSVKHATTVLKRARHQTEGMTTDDEDQLERLEREIKRIRTLRQGRQADPQIPQLRNKLRLAPPSHAASPLINNEIKATIDGSLAGLSDLIHGLSTAPRENIPPQLSALLTNLMDEDGIVGSIKISLETLSAQLEGPPESLYHRLGALISSNFNELTKLFKGGANEGQLNILHRMIGGFESNKPCEAYLQDPTLFTLLCKVNSNSPIFTTIRAARVSLIKLLKAISPLYGSPLKNATILAHIPDQARSCLTDLSVSGITYAEFSANISNWHQAQIFARLSLLDTAQKIETQNRSTQKIEADIFKIETFLIDSAKDFSDRRNSLMKLRQSIKKIDLSFKDPETPILQQRVIDFLEGDGTALDSLYKDQHIKQQFINKLKLLNELKAKAAGSQSETILVNSIAAAISKHRSFVKLLTHLARKVKPRDIKPEFTEQRTIWDLICTSWATASYLDIDPETRARLYFNGLESLSDPLVWQTSPTINAADFERLKIKYIEARDALSKVNLGQADQNAKTLPGFDLAEDFNHMDEESFAQEAPDAPPPPQANNIEFTWDKLTLSIQKTLKSDPSKTQKVAEILRSAYTDALLYVDAKKPTPAQIRDLLKSNKLSS